MIRVRLREAIEAHAARNGGRLTYARVAEMAGVSRATIESLAVRPGYNATLDLIDRLCSVLDCSPADLLEHVPEQPALSSRALGN